MEFQVSCDCGAEVTVSSSQAGGTVDCRCGRTISVPRLSELRTAAGKSRFASNAVDRVNGMLKRDELPTVKDCPACGRSGNATLVIGIQCEKVSTTDPSDQRVSLFGMLFFAFGWLSSIAAILRLSTSNRGMEIHGRETRLEVPIRFCSECVHKTKSRPRNRNIRKLLISEPAYQEVLKEYPSAGLEVVQLVPDSLRSAI
ncbi:MAG: hypothetical protein AAF802_25515 [Planctomycetota bacterium]